ncbi:MAG: hypothetical protein HYZ87_05095, partial [Candidatus Omnitrophica bacterium]|nr:hypothetical protein [Candidatus Omnitrophota bacterium]
MGSIVYAKDSDKSPGYFVVSSVRSSVGQKATFYDMNRRQAGVVKEGLRIPAEGMIVCVAKGAQVEAIPEGRSGSEPIRIQGPLSSPLKDVGTQQKKESLRTFVAVEQGTVWTAALVNVDGKDTEVSSTVVKGLGGAPATAGAASNVVVMDQCGYSDPFPPIEIALSDNVKEENIAERLKKIVSGIEALEEQRKTQEKAAARAGEKKKEGKTEEKTDTSTETNTATETDTDTTTSTSTDTSTGTSADTGTGTTVTTGTQTQTTTGTGTLAVTATETLTSTVVRTGTSTSTATATETPTSTSTGTGTKTTTPTATSTGTATKTTTPTATSTVT